jgi:iron complex transport system ATP-binding protein
MLKVTDLSFKYKQNRILENISFEVKQNEIVSILGPNGAGKTTLLKCINRILKFKHGRIFINDDDISSYTQNKIAKNISYVPQRSETSGLTVFDYILLGRKPHIKFNANGNDLKLVNSIITILDLNKISLRYTDELSGGEFQKVLIARALAQDPKIILLDEPTSSLDLKNQLDILKLIRDISENHNISVIMTMHDVNIALRYSDKIIFLKNGNILFQSMPSEVTPEMIEKVYDVKVNIKEYDEFKHIIPVES